MKPYTPWTNPAQDLPEFMRTSMNLVISYQAPAETLINPARLRDYNTISLKTWIGGWRSRPQAWEEPRNWYPYGVPGWNDKVVIGGYERHACHIVSHAVDISALSILPEAKLTLGPNARLTIDGILADPLGMLADSGFTNAGSFYNSGTLTIRNAAHKGMRNQGLMVNEGTIVADETVTAAAVDWGRFIDNGRRLFLAE